MTEVGGQKYYPTVLEGSEYFHSTQIHCPSCLHQRRNIGESAEVVENFGKDDALVRKCPRCIYRLAVKQHIEIARTRTCPIQIRFFDEIATLKR